MVSRSFSIAHDLVLLLTPELVTEGGIRAFSSLPLVGNRPIQVSYLICETEDMNQQDIDYAAYVRLGSLQAHMSSGLPRQVPKLSSSIGARMPLGEPDKTRC